MGHDFINDLLNALKRVVNPEESFLREILIVSGMPRKTEKLRYLSFNRQKIKEENRTLEFSAVAVINNRRINQWRLSGYQKKISQLIFNTRWNRNPLDLFLNRLRCDQEMMDILDSAKEDYTLLGILQVEEKTGTNILNRRFSRRVRPVVAIAGVDDHSLKKVIDFEASNEIAKRKIKGLPIYRKKAIL